MQGQSTNLFDDPPQPVPNAHRKRCTRPGKTPLHREGKGTGKTCGGCKTFKPYDAFPWNVYKSKKNHIYRNGRCNECKAKGTRAWAKAKYGDRASHAVLLRRVYGLSLEDYDAMLAAQHGVCAICRKVESAPKRGGVGTVRPLAVDHDHATGKVRALLCAACNGGLGCFRDNPNLLHAAISYLSKFA